MREKDYILATDLAKLRSAVAVLAGIVPENTAMALRAGPYAQKRDPARLEREWKLIMRGLDIWTARLEWKLEQEHHGRAAIDDEPWRREWPTVEEIQEGLI